MILILSAPGLYAQGQTGSIAGVVRDTSGAVLPGVTVEASSPALIEKSRTVVTDGQGRYTVVDLRPGTYSVAFTLPGFATVRREGIELTTGFTANVNADLKVGTIEETVTVTGESPIVDTQSTTKLATASREAMDVLPTDRNFVSFAALTPSVLVTGVRQNVGGSIPETGMNLVVHGSRASDSLVTVEGMPIINGGGTGGLMYGNYLNNGLAQEITFQTDSHNAEFERATVYSNFIPKEGSNTFRGSFFGRWAGESWQSDNLSDEQMAQGLQTGNRIDRIWDVNPDAGGPIVRDRLWVYGGFRHWGTYNTVAGSFKDADFSEIFYQPTTEQNLFPVWHESAVARFTVQANQKNKFNVYTDWQYTYFGNCFVPTYLTAISACPEYKNIPQYILQGSWSSPVTNKLLLEAGGTITPQDFHGYRRPGVSETQFAMNDPTAPAGMPQNWGSSATGYGYNRSDQIELPGVGQLRDRLARDQGRVHADARVALQHAGAEQLRHAQRSWHAAVLADAVRDADPVPRDAALQHGPLRPGSVAHQSVHGELRRAARFPQRTRRCAEHRRRSVHARAGISTRSRTCRTGRTSIPASASSGICSATARPPSKPASVDTLSASPTPSRERSTRYRSSVNNVTRTWATPAGVTYNGDYNPYNDCDLFNPAANTKRPGQIQCGPINNPAFGQVTARTTNYDPASHQRLARAPEQLGRTGEHSA